MLYQNNCECKNLSYHNDTSNLGNIKYVKCINCGQIGPRKKRFYDWVRENMFGIHLIVVLGSIIMSLLIINLIFILF